MKRHPERAKRVEGAAINSNRSLGYARDDVYYLLRIPVDTIEVFKRHFKALGESLFSLA
jgi:hypothetical protein